MTGGMGDRQMGIHFDTYEACMAHIRRIDPSTVDSRIKFRIEKYADGTCLLLIDASETVPA